MRSHEPHPARDRDPPQRGAASESVDRHDATTTEYSLVIPIYDEAECLPELIEQLEGLMEHLDGTAEVVFVDDGSRDDSYPVMLEAAGRDPRFKIVQLSRNFGHQVAITAGIDFASGNAVIVMDADLQDPPEVVVEMAARWREGYEVVYAIREERQGESVFKRATARLFYSGLRRLTDVEAPANVGDFRLVDRKAVEAFNMMREKHRYVRGMFGWIGFKQCGVLYTRSPRFAGRSKYPLRKMANFAFDGVIGFSSEPLRVALKIGFFLSAMSIVAGIAAIVAKLSGAFVVPGWASLTVAITFLGGVQLATLGIMGEYISHIHDEVLGRPLYLVRETYGLREHAPTIVPSAGFDAAKRGQGVGASPLR